MEKEKAIKILEGLAYDYDRIACLTMDSDADTKAEAIRMAIGALEGSCKVDNSLVDELKLHTGVTISNEGVNVLNSVSEPRRADQTTGDKVIAMFIEDESILHYISEVIRRVKESK